MKRSSRRRHFPNLAHFNQLEPRRLFAVGSLDTSFSSDGKQIFDVAGRSMVAADVAVQSDGKTVVVGTSSAKSFESDFVAARFNIDGTPDTTFGSGGVVYTSLGGNKNCEGKAVAIQPDGKIVVAGSAYLDETLSFDDWGFAVVRYLPNGNLDKTFDGDGKLTFKIGIAQSSHAQDVALQLDGKIVIGGYTVTAVTDDFEMAIVRLNTDGSLDGTFDGDGKASISLGDFDVCQAIAIDYNGTKASNPHYGKIVMAGYRGEKRVTKLALARVNTNGSIDKSFDTDGKVILTIPGRNYSEANSVMIQPEGKVVVGGSVKDPKYGSGGTTDDFLLARFLGNGAIDTSFGSTGNGLIQADLGGAEGARAILPSTDGGIIIGGTSNGLFAMASYNADGQPRTTFGNTGTVITPNFSGKGTYGGLAAGPGKRFVMSIGNRFATARYMDTGAGVVTIGTFNVNAYEVGRKGTGFIVGRPERLPTPTRVYLNISGTARAPGGFPVRKGVDYSATGISIGDGLTTSTYVDILANETFASVAIKPADDANIEGPEYAVFSIVPNAAYEPDANSKVAITIHDNDGTVLPATADTYVRDGVNAEINYGGDIELSVKKASAGFNRQVYMKFHISSVPTINVARLRLFGRLTAAAGDGIGTSVFGSPTTNWSESKLNFANRPAITGSALATTLITSTTPRWYEWDVTPYIQAQKAAGKTVVTLVLTNLINSSQFATFNSRELGSGPELLVG